MNRTTFQKIAAIVWIFFLVSCLAYIATHSSEFTPENIAKTISEFSGSLLIVYIFLSFVRGFTLIPSTPLVLAGVLLFPDTPVLVLAISILGILFSSSMIYFFSDFLGFSEYINRWHSRRIEYIHTKLEQTSGFFFVFLWAFLPFVPTDAVCYAAGALKMNYIRFIVAIALGESILCTCYIFGSGYSYHFLKQLF